jgi:hypothetical protein
MDNKGFPWVRGDSENEIDCDGAMHAVRREVCLSVPCRRRYA